MWNPKMPRAFDDVRKTIALDNKLEMTQGSKK
jgi:hypothetical protein